MEYLYGGREMRRGKLVINPTTVTDGNFSDDTCTKYKKIPVQK